MTDAKPQPWIPQGQTAGEFVQNLNDSLNYGSLDTTSVQKWWEHGWGEGFKAGLAEGYRMAVEESYPELRGSTDELSEVRRGV